MLRNRYRELKSGDTETFVLGSFLPETNYGVHISQMKLRGEQRSIPGPHPIYAPQIYR